MKKSLLALLVVLISACSTPKHITYFQDVKPGESEFALAAPVDIRLRPNDKVSIIVNTPDYQLTNQFNLPVVSQQIGVETSLSGTARGLMGYTVDPDGMISFPVLGKLKVAGMTRAEVAAYITRQLQDNDLVKEPVVTVEYMNFSIEVLGEVSNPGRYDIDKDNFTILEAISRASDLTIYGLRQNVMVLRQVNGKQQAFAVDLTSAEQLYSSPVYYLQQGDVVYVAPNDPKKRQSTINGNNVRSTSFWISLSSLLTSILVLITN